jgi:hypothetical protein
MRFLSCALLIVLLAAVPARAQQDTTGNADPALPEIAPREVEIRGELDISLPALQRPAVSGLLPSSPLQPLPSAPLPEPASLPEPAGVAPRTLPGEAGASSSFAALPPPRAGLLEAGAGRYLSRFARMRFDQPLAPQWTLRPRLNYIGTDGFAPFDAKNVETPADELRGAATLRTERPAFTAALTADGFFAQHPLYGAVGAGGRDLAAQPNRDRYGGGAELHVQAGGGTGATLEARAHANAAQVTTDASTGEGARFERREQRVGGFLSGGGPVGDVRLEASARGSAARFSGSFADRTSSSNASFLDAGAGVGLRRSEGLRVFAGARVLTFSGGSDGGLFFAPDVRLTWQATPHMALYARTNPHTAANRLAARYRENPSLLYEAAPQPNVFTLDAESGLRFFAERALELSAFAGYRRAPSLLFYEDERTRRYERGVTAARYGEARIIRAGGALSVRRGERLSASLSVAYRRGTLASSDAEIPYFSPLTAEASASYAFLGGDGHVRLTGTFESSRPLARVGDGEVGAFADLDVEGRYALTPTISVVAGLENISAGALERFDRYPRPPLVVQSGLRLHL